MKVIDLLNKIANGEEVPKKIKYHNDIHILQKSNSTKPLNCYYCKESHCHLFGTFYDYDLNDEVEIIKDSIIRLPKEVRQPNNFEEVVYIAEDLVNKINEIIDYLESKGDE